MQGKEGQGLFWGHGMGMDGNHGMAVLCTVRFGVHRNLPPFSMLARGTWHVAGKREEGFLFWFS